MRKYHCIDYDTFGKRISKRRTELHLSQKELAEQLDCNESYLSKLENGKAKPTLDFAFLLAKQLNVGIDYFLPQTATGHHIAKQEIEKKWGNCSPELIQFLDKILEIGQQFEAIVLAKDKLY